MAQGSRSIGYFSRGPGLNSQHLPGSSQLSVIPGPGGPTHTVYKTHTCKQNIHSHKIKIMVKKTLKKKKQKRP